MSSKEGEEEHEGEEINENEEKKAPPSKKEEMEIPESPFADYDEDYEQQLEEEDYFEEAYGAYGSGSFSSKRNVGGGGGKYGDISTSAYSRRKKKKKERRKDKQIYKGQGGKYSQNVHMLKRVAKRRYNILRAVANRIGINLEDIMTVDDVVEAIKRSQENSSWNKKNTLAEQRRARESEQRDIQNAIDQSLIVHKDQIKVKKQSANNTSNLTNLEQLLYDLQFREITPQDYELLGLLDESVTPKTTSKTAMSKNTEIRKAEEKDCEEPCAICYEKINVGEEVRVITHCNHFFHRDCIDRYLEEFSRKCPTCRVDVTEI